MNDPFADTFQELAEQGRRVPLEDVVQMLGDRFADCEEHDGQHLPDVFVLMMCPEGIKWLHTGITHERAVYMMTLATHNLMRGQDEDDEE